MAGMDDYYRSRIRQMGLSKPDAYTPYAAGNKMYGYGRSNATSGAISTDGMQGYRERDRQARMRRQTALNRMQAGDQGNYLSQPWLKGNVARGRT